MHKKFLIAAILVASRVNAQPVTVGGRNPQLPDTLGPNGGLKVECIAGTCTGSGGAAATVAIDQTTNGTSNAVFVNNFPGIQPVSGTIGVNNFPTAANTSAIAVRCVNVAGNAFESCAGGGGSAATVAIDQTTNGTTNAVFVNNFPATQAVSGTIGVNNFPANQTVSLSQTGTANDVDVLTLPAINITNTAFGISGAIPAGANTIGGVNVISLPALPTGSNSIGTVTANQGTASADINPWPIKDGLVTPVTASWTTATALNTTAVANTSGYGAITFTVRSPSTITDGTLTFQASDDNTNWYPLAAIRTDGSAVLETSFRFLGTAITRAWTANLKGFTQFRIILTLALAGSGTVNIQIDPSALPEVPIVALSGTPNVNVSNTPSVSLSGTGAVNVTQFGGTNISTGVGASGVGIPRITLSNDSTLAANQSVNISQLAGTITSVNAGVSDAGTLRIIQAQEATYSAGTALKTATTAGTGPFFTICGSATKVIRIQRFVFSGTVSTTAVYGDIVLKRTSTATSAGTATALTKLPYDSNSAAATAAPVNFYTALATAGTSVGVIYTAQQFFPITGTPALMPQPLYVAWRDVDSEAVTLRGVAQCMEASFGTTTTNAPTLTVGVVWTEK